MESRIGLILVWIIIITVMGYIYLIPSIVAWEGKKSTFNSILVINILLGWTVIGWIVALAWAVYPERKKEG